MVNTTLPFAMALLDLGQEENQEALFYEKLSALNSVYRDNPDLVLLLNAPTVSVKQKEDVLDSLFGSEMPQTLQHFLQVLARHRMAGKIPEIFDDYVKLYNQAHGIEKVRVTSASPLSESQIEDLKALLKDKLQKEIELETLVDPALIAGLRIETESRTVDHSYAARLNKMKEQLQKG